MDAAEFDLFADEYTQLHRANIAITGEAPEYFASYKIEVLSGLASGATCVLDFGSGIGNSTPHIRRLLPGAALICVDPSRKSLAVAEARYPGAAQTLCMAGDRIPLPDDAVDVAFSACVFHHIPHSEHVHWLAELRRVTRPGGLLAVFEHNPLNPLTVRAVNTCPFDANARLIAPWTLASAARRAGWHRPRARYHVFFPRALKFLRWLEPHLSAVCVGAQYSVCATNPGAP